MCPAQDDIDSRGGSILAGDLFPVDTAFEDITWLKDENLARRDRNFLPAFRIAADTLAFAANDERAERRQFHDFALLQAIGDFVQNHFDESG
jgi:hypothetical protein